MSLIQQAENEITVLGGLIDQDNHQKFELSLHNKGKKGYGCWSGNPLGILALHCPKIKDDGRLQQPSPGR